MSFASFVTAVVSLFAGLFLSATAPAQAPAPTPIQQVAPTEITVQSPPPVPSQVHPAKPSNAVPDRLIVTRTHNNLDNSTTPNLSRSENATVVPSSVSALSSYGPTPGTVKGEPYKLIVATYVGYRDLSTPLETITNQPVVQ